MTWQHCKKNCKTANQQNFVNKITIPTPLKNNQSFYSFAGVKLSVFFHICLHGGADVRTVGRKWRHNQNQIFGIDGLPNFLTNGDLHEVSNTASKWAVS